MTKVVLAILSLILIGSIVGLVYSVKSGTKHYNYHGYSVTTPAYANELNLKYNITLEPLESGMIGVTYNFESKNIIPGLDMYTRTISGLFLTFITLMTCSLVGFMITIAASASSGEKIR